MSTLVLFTMLSIVLFFSLQREWKLIPKRTRALALQARYRRMKNVNIRIQVSFDNFVEELKRVSRALKNAETKIDHTIRR